MALLTLVVNTAIIGNYSDVNVGVKVPGIFAPGTYNGTAVNLLPYFSGGLASTNNGGSSGEVQNFPGRWRRKPVDDEYGCEWDEFESVVCSFRTVMHCGLGFGADARYYVQQPPDPFVRILRHAARLLEDWNRRLPDLCW